MISPYQWMIKLNMLHMKRFSEAVRNKLWRLKSRLKCMRHRTLPSGSTFQPPANPEKNSCANTLSVHYFITDTSTDCCMPPIVSNQYDASMVKLFLQNEMTATSARVYIERCVQLSKEEHQELSIYLFIVLVWHLAMLSKPRFVGW